jgi:NAD-dependent SIR2 family protein deacetylase
MGHVDGFNPRQATCPVCGKALDNAELLNVGHVLDGRNRPVLFAACREHYAQAREHVLATLGFHARSDRPSSRHATSEQFPSSSRQHFESFGHVFGCSDRVFAVLGCLNPAVDGRILWRDFLTAFSWVCHHRETRCSLPLLLAHLEHAGWERVAGPGAEATFRSGGFTLSVRVAGLAPDREAIHVFVGYGSTESAVAQYLGHMFPHHARRILPIAPPRGSSRARTRRRLGPGFELPTPDPSQGAPGENQRQRPAPRYLQTADLARRLRGEPCTVLTGAGISTASGIRTFTGPGSLDACMRLAGTFPAGLIGRRGPASLREAGAGCEEPFAGSALDWMLHRPSELASLIASFQAPLLTARPNRAHFALTELERRGVVQQLLTSNFDELHQSAGSVRVKEIGNGEDGVADLRGRVLLVAGVSRDEHGLVRAARASGMDVVVLNLEVPEFIEETDLYLPGRAEVVLPELAAMLGP